MARFTQNLAIAIGINQYHNGIVKLNTAKPDAETLADLLRDEYQYQVELITDDTERKPTLKELEILLTKWLPEQLQPPAEKNRLLFYFAGHGMPLESDDGPRGFLLPQDADPKNSTSFLPMQVLHDALVALPCHHLLVILDCCFAGSFRWASTRKLIPIPETIHQEHYDRFIRYRAWQVITSAAHNQEALDFLSDKRGISKKSQDKKHSPFAEALFEALQYGDPDEKGRQYKKADLTKDGVITAPELYLYLRDNVETRSSDRQTPGLYPLKKHDRGEYIFHDPNFDPQTLSKADPIDKTNNPYRGLKPFEEEHARFFFGRQELIETLYARIAVSDHSLSVVLGASGSGKSSLVKAGLIPYLRELSEPEMFAVNLAKVCILTAAILDVFPKLLFLPQLLPINFVHQWHILNPIRPGESPFTALARTIWAIADLPTTVELDSLGFLSERLNKETKELNTQAAKAANKHGETSCTTQRLKQKAKKLAQITATWNQDSHAAKQQLIVEHFEILYALCQTQGEPESQQQRQLKQVFLGCLNPLTRRLQSAPNSLVEIVKAWSQKHLGVKLLLIIDQFEELITLGRKAQPNSQSNTPEEWRQFLQLLETTLAATLPQLRIIVTLRSDFEPRFLNSEALKSYWTKARFPLRPMRSDELRQAIEGPASEMALYFEPANLVDHLIDEVGQMPGALPLLSFTLSELYIKLVKKRKAGESSGYALTIDTEFDKEGGVAGSLTRRANEEYKKIGEDKTLGEAAQRTMRRVMLRMLTLEGGQTARRRVPESELVYPTKKESDRVKQVVDSLVEARLLVKGQLESGEPCVEATHDFLVRGWGMLQDWIDEEKAKETLELQQRLTAQANDWVRNQGPLLPEGERLNRLERILKQERSPQDSRWLNKLETEFIYASLDNRDQQNRQAREQRTRTELLQKADRVASLVSSQPLQSLTLAIAAIGQNLNIFPNQILPQVQTSLHQAERIREKVPLLLPGHTKWITAIAFSNGDDSQNVITGSADGTVRLWDLQGNCIWQKSLEGVNSIAFSHNNSSIILGTNSGLYLDATLPLDSLPTPLSTLGSIGWFENYISTVNSVAFSPDGQRIVSGSDDRTVRVWNLQGSQIGKPFIGHEGAVKAVAFSPDGKMIVSGGYHHDCSLRLWNLDGEPIGEPFRREKIGVLCVAFHPDGQRIISGGIDLTLRLWHISGELLAEVPVPGFDNSIDSVAFSPDGQLLVSSDMLAVRLWQVGSNKIEQIIELENNYNSSICAFSPNGKLIASSISENLYLWNLQDFTVCQPVGKHDTPVLFVTFNRQGDRIFSISTKKTSNIIDREIVEIVALEPTFKSWDIGFVYTTLPFSSENKVDLVKVSPDGRFAVTQTNNGKTVQLWSLQGEPISQSLNHQDYVKSGSTQLSRNGQYILTISASKKFNLWDIQGNLRESFYTDPNVLGADISPNGQYIVNTNNTTLKLWDTVNNTTTNLVVNNSHKGFDAITFSPDGELFTCATPEHSILLWDIKGNVKHTLDGHLSSITSIVFSPDGEYFVSSSSDETIRLWDIHGNSIGQPLRGHRGNVWTVAFSPDGEYIVSGGEDGTVRLWKCHWREWLKACCNHLYYHPVFQNPETIENQEQRQIAIAAYETCKTYVWSKENTSV